MYFLYRKAVSCTPFSNRLTVSGTVKLDLFFSSGGGGSADQRHTGWHGACRYATRPLPHATPN